MVRILSQIRNRTRILDSEFMDPDQGGNLIMDALDPAPTSGSGFVTETAKP
jgi:hypothetical protein